MSKKKSLSNKKNTLPKGYSGADPLLSDTCKQRIERVRQFQRDYGLVVLTNGVVGEGETFNWIIDRVLRENPNFWAFVENLKAAQPDEMIHCPGERDPKFKMCASDAVLDIAFDCADQGFLLGLAVGTLL